MDTKLVVFQNKEIRRTLHNNEWWFSVVDVCHALTGSADAGAYWRKLKQRLKQEGSEVVTNCHGLKLMAADGKKYITDCANTEGLFRIIQSIPSPKYKEFKGLDRENLRDHMSDLELIFSMLGEAATTEIARKHDAQGFGENRVAARKGGTIAGDARKKLEIETGEQVATPENFLVEPESRKRLKGKE